MTTPWPDGFERIPDQAWTRDPIESLAVGYDTVEQHGWYDNLDPTVQDLAGFLTQGDIAVDYSGGTGILLERLLAEIGEKPVGLLDVDSSRKFLRLALEKLGDDERVAFRYIPYRKEEGRVSRMQEVLDPWLLDRGVDAITSTNAIHLYDGLEDTLSSWHDLLRPEGRVFIQSGNIDRPGRPDERWVIDATIDALSGEAERIAAEDDSYQVYRSRMRQEAWMDRHRDLRDRYFLPLRELDHYLNALEASGFEILEVEHRPIEARVDDWYDFLKVYHEGILGWVGGSQKVTGVQAPKEAIDARLTLMRQALDRVLGGKETFLAEWTYITCEPV